VSSKFENCSTFDKETAGSLKQAGFVAAAENKVWTQGRNVANIEICVASFGERYKRRKAVSGANGATEPSRCSGR
jgi:predicted RecB family endonuclease